MKQTRLNMLTGAVGILATLVVLVLLNAAVNTVRVRADLTSEKLYTLSPGTRELLQALNRDVTLRFYFSRSADAAPIAFKQYGNRILDLLREYESLSGGRVRLEVLDPEPDSDAEEWALRYGLSASRLDPSGNAAPVFLGLVALSGARQSAIPFFSPGDEPQLEYLLSRAIYEATASQKPKLGVISPLPVMGSTAMFAGGQDAWIFISELRASAELTELSSDLVDIPHDIDTVLVIYPRNLSDSVLYALDQFVLRGGRLFALEDPQCLTDMNAQSREFRNPMESRGDLNKLTSAWGITMDASRVVADPQAATRISTPNGTVERHNAWLTLRPSNFNKQDVAIAALDMMQLPLAGWFHTEAMEGLTVTPLITASPDAGSVTVMEATSGVEAGLSSFQKEPGPMALAIKVTGHFKTAFPNGRPTPHPDNPAAQRSSNHTNEHLTESTRDGAVVLVADADFIYDAFAARRLPMLGPGVYQFMNDNLNFAANIAGQLTGGNALIRLRSRGTFERPFTRVLAMQATAQERWRQEEQKLQARLRETQMKLDTLQTDKSDDQKLIISPEQKREIEHFRTQLADTRKELKHVRKNLRREIETLGIWIKTINIAAIPALVVLFGITHAWRRRRRARA